MACPSRVGRIPDTVHGGSPPASPVPCAYRTGTAARLSTAAVPEAAHLAGARLDRLQFADAARLDPHPVGGDAVHAEAAPQAVEHRAADLVPRPALPGDDVDRQPVRGLLNHLVLRHAVEPADDVVDVF